MEVPRKLLIIFDIDETLIQFIPGKYAEEILPKIKEFHFDYTQEPKSKNIIIFRPHIKELFHFFKKNHKHISVAIWTYSERDYANDVAAAISHFCDLGGANFFKFRYGVEDMEDEDFPKSLPYIWGDYPEYNKFNTFLVDDRAANLVHSHTKSKSIIIQPFIPFSADKERKVMPDSHIEKESRDIEFKSLKEICQGLIKDVKGCDDDDIMCAIESEHIFSKKRVERSGLSKFMKQYTHKGVEIDLMTLGEPEQTPHFNKKVTSKHESSSKKSSSSKSKHGGKKSKTKSKKNYSKKSNSKKSKSKSKSKKNKKNSRRR